MGKPHDYCHTNEDVSMACLWTVTQGMGYQKPIIINDAFTPVGVNECTQISTGSSLSRPCPDMCQLKYDCAGADSKPYCQLKIEDRIKDIHYIGGQVSQMKLGAWQRELNFMEDPNHREYLLQGITRGFPIVDSVHIPNMSVLITNILRNLVPNSSYRNCSMMRSARGLLY